MRRAALCFSLVVSLNEHGALRGRTGRSHRAQWFASPTPTLEPIAKEPIAERQNGRGGLGMRQDAKRQSRTFEMGNCGKCRTATRLFPACPTGRLTISRKFPLCLTFSHAMARVFPPFPIVFAEPTSRRQKPFTPFALRAEATNER